MVAHLRALARNFTFACHEEHSFTGLLESTAPTTLAEAAPRLRSMPVKKTCMHAIADGRLLFLPGLLQGADSAKPWIIWDFWLAEKTVR
jgi:hypothetical protein